MYQIVPYDVCFFGTSRETDIDFFKGLFSRRSRKIKGWKISGRMEKWEDIKYLVFPRVCVCGWRDGKVGG